MCLVRSQPWFWHGPLDHVSFASTRKECCSTFLRGLLLNWYSWTLRGSCLALTSCWSRAVALWLTSLVLPVSLFWSSGRWVSTISSRVSTYVQESARMSQMTAYKMTSEGMLKPQHVFCSYPHAVIRVTLIASSCATFLGPFRRDCIFSAPVQGIFSVSIWSST